MYESIRLGMKLDSITRYGANLTESCIKTVDLSSSKPEQFLKRRRPFHLYKKKLLSKLRIKFIVFII